MRSNSPSWIVFEGLGFQASVLGFKHVCCSVYKVYGCGVPGCGFRPRPRDVPQRHVGAKKSKGWDRILKMSKKPRRDFCPTSCLGVNPYA